MSKNIIPQSTPLFMVAQYGSEIGQVVGWEVHDDTWYPVVAGVIGHIGPVFGCYRPALIQDLNTAMGYFTTLDAAVEYITEDEEEQS